MQTIIPMGSDGNQFVPVPIPFNATQGALIFVGVILVFVIGYGLAKWIWGGD